MRFILRRMEAPPPFSPYAEIAPVAADSSARVSIFGWCAAYARLVSVLLLLCIAAICTLSFPFISRSLRLGVICRWCRAVLAALQLQIALEGQEKGVTGLLVANHISWLDPVVLCAIWPSPFVAKSECVRWPVVGFIMRQCDAVFVTRASARSSVVLCQAIAQRFKSDPKSQRLALFPEGTTTTGTNVLPFSSAAFAGAIACDLPIHPIALYYRSQASPSAAPYAFIGDDALLCSLMRIAKSGAGTVYVAKLPMIDAGTFDDRKLLSSFARQCVADAVCASRDR